MTIPFHKYQGTGNDFVLIDQRSNIFITKADTEPVKKICDRRFGIGADGLILLQQHPDFDFEMIYFNSNGRESSMCGNGGRCIAAFARRLGLVKDRCTFLAVDGPHEAKLISEQYVELKMSDVASAEASNGYHLINTGSPHYVVFVEDLSDLNVVESGQVIRYSDRFRQQGINVNFVEKTGDGIEVATYERGVEDETLSCGTGVTAAALAWKIQQADESPNEIKVTTKGGELKVRFELDDHGGFKNVWLCGPAELVFEGLYR